MLICYFQGGCYTSSQGGCYKSFKTPTPGGNPREATTTIRSKRLDSGFRMPTQGPLKGTSGDWSIDHLGSKVIWYSSSQKKNSWLGPKNRIWGKWNFSIFRLVGFSFWLVFEGVQSEMVKFVGVAYHNHHPNPEKKLSFSTLQWKLKKYEKWATKKTLLLLIMAYYNPHITG